MENQIDDIFYHKIMDKINLGIYTKGKIYRLIRTYIKHGIFSISLDKRTPTVYASLMAYNQCRLADVPEEFRTKEFFIDSFSNQEVYHYIKSHIEEFDRQFFKDLIASNKYSMQFKRNCFSIMPLDYIDEEMCSLAIVSSLDRIGYDWFYSVYERKPEILTADLWKLGARLYANVLENDNPFLAITPEEFKDEEYYKEMCSCSFNSGVPLNESKKGIMETIPSGVLTPKFLFDLVLMDVFNVSRFSEKALETEISYILDNQMMIEKIWQFAVRLNGNCIKYIHLNEERVNYFMSYYDKESFEYGYSFAINYKNYERKKIPEGCQESELSTYYCSTEDHFLGSIDEKIKSIGDTCFDIVKKVKKSPKDSRPYHT